MMYAPLAHCAMYWSFGVSTVHRTPLLLVLLDGLVLIILRFLHCRSCVRVILSVCSLIMPLLNLIGVFVVSCSHSLAMNLASCSLSCSIDAKSLSARKGCHLSVG